MRKYYLDNIKWIIIVLVLVYHVISIFSSNGSIMSYNAKGIAMMDSLGYVIYPWFMPILFVIAGINARYSLRQRSTKEFRRERLWKLFLPFLTYLFLIGPFVGELAFRMNHYDTLFAALPVYVRLLIKLLNGMGPAWFLLQLYLISYGLLLVRKLDKKERLFAIGKKCNFFVLLSLFFPVLISAQIFNLVYTFRNGLYFLLFLLGYYLFSEDRVQKLLEKWCILFLGFAFLTGILQTYLSWGEPFPKVVGNGVVMLYTWLMILGGMGAGGRWLNQNNRFTRYMTKRSFGLYLFHYLPMVYFSYILTTYVKLPSILNYIFVFGLSFVAAIASYEILSRILIVNVLLGLKKKII